MSAQVENRAADFSTNVRPLNASQYKAGLDARKYCEVRDRKHRAGIVEADLEAGQQRREDDLSLGDGEARAEANARARAERHKYAFRIPGDRFAFKSGGHERRGIGPELAVTMHYPQADPDLRSRVNLFAGHHIISNGLPRDLRHGWIEPQR